jgi:CRP/FNR family cyclic AMP-dependent transcriptional regulator
MSDHITALQETELFRGLAIEQITKVLGIARIVSFSEGDIIMKEGEVGNTMYVMLEGTVEVVKSLIMHGFDDESFGKNKVFTRLDARQHPVFGEIALLEEVDRTATIIAVTDCQLYEINKDDFLKLIESDARLGYVMLLNLARIVSARLRKADEDTIKLTTALSIVLQQS